MTTHDYKVTDLVVATEENHWYPKGQLGVVIDFFDSYPIVSFVTGELCRVYDFDEIEPYHLPQEEEPEPSTAMEWNEFAQILDGIGSRAEYNHPDADPVEHPAHYNNGGIECIEYLKDNMSWEGYTGYLEGNCKKYMHRWRHKAKPLEDLKKARWYLDRLIGELEGPDEP
jgi:hypothetical protein